MALTRDQKKHRIAVAARDSFPPLPPDNRDAANRQDGYAWTAVTAAAAVNGMDGSWLGTCMEALGLLPYPRGAVDGMKTCKGCGVEKPIGKDAGAFPQNRQTADGFGMYCHDCKDGQES